MLHNKVNNYIKVRSGPKPILSAELEDRIEMLIKMVCIGYGQTCEQIQDKSKNSNQLTCHTLEGQLVLR